MFLTNMGSIPSATISDEKIRRQREERRSRSSLCYVREGLVRGSFYTTGPA